VMKLKVGKLNMKGLLLIQGAMGIGPDSLIIRVLQT